MLTRIKQFAIKVESSEGTAETLTASEVTFDIEELTPSITRNMNERRPLRQTLSSKVSVPGIRTGEISGRAELIGSGAADEAPPIAPLLLASGATALEVYSIDVGSITGTFRHGEGIFVDGDATKTGIFIAMLDEDTMLYAQVGAGAFENSDTIEGAFSGASTDAGDAPSSQLGVAYRPAHPETTKTVTAAVNSDGKLHQVHGARATGQITAEAGGIPYYEFTLTGAGSKPADNSLFTGIDLVSTVPEVFLSAGLAIGGDLIDVSSFACDLGNTVAQVLSANTAGGIRKSRITERAPTITIDPEAALEATVKFYDRYDAATPFDFICQIGQTAGKRIFIAAPNATFSSLAEGDREGTLTYQSELRLNGLSDAGDDEWIIAFC